MTGRPYKAAKGGQHLKRTPKRQSFTAKENKAEMDREIGDRIRYVRTVIAGLTRRLEFAEKLGVTRGAVGNWELGQGINRDNLVRIAAAYEVSHTWLVTGEGVVQPRATLRIENKLQLLPPEDQLELTTNFDTMVEQRLARLEKGRTGKSTEKTSKPAT